MNVELHQLPIVPRMLLRCNSTGCVYRVITSNAFGDLTALCDINDSSWPFLQPTIVLQQRLSEAADPLSKLSLELSDPWSQHVGQNHSPSDVLRIQRNWALISPLLEPHNLQSLLCGWGRTSLLDNHAKVVGSTRQTLSKLLKQYWKRGLSIAALGPDFHKCGSRGKARAFADTKSGPKGRLRLPGAPRNAQNLRQLRIAADWYLVNPKNRTHQMALDRVSLYFGKSKEALGVNGLIDVVIDKTAQPTVRQLQYLITQEYPHSVLRRRQLGEKGFLLQGRDFKGRADSHVSGPGDSFVLDATTADVYLVSQFDPTIIVGRPTVYFAVDVYSRLIVGIYVGFENPSWTAAMILLANIATPKVAYCAEFGVDIDESMWPSHFLPSTLLGDKGEMMANRAGPLVVEKLGVKIENAPSGRADFKACVERRFGIVPNKFKPFTPGYVEKDFGKRGSRDYRLDAALNLYEFTQLIILSVINCNSMAIKDFPTPPDMTARGLPPTPLDLWSHGIATRSGLLRFFLIDEVRKNVLPRATGTVTHKGIVYKNVIYTCQTAIKEEWFIRARSGSWRVEIAFDPRDLGLIWLCNDDGFEECSLAGTNSMEFKYKGISLAEQVELLNLEKTNLATHEERHSSIRVSTTRRIEQICNQATGKKERKLVSEGKKKLSTKNIRESNKFERESHRLGEAGANSVIHTENFDITTDARITDNPSSSPPSSSPHTSQIAPRDEQKHSSLKVLDSKSETLETLRKIRGKS